MHYWYFYLSKIFEYFFHHWKKRKKSRRRMKQRGNLLDIVGSILGVINLLPAVGQLCRKRKRAFVLRHTHRKHANTLTDCTLPADNREWKSSV